MTNPNPFGPPKGIAPPNSTSISKPASPTPSVPSVNLNMTPQTLPSEPLSQKSSDKPSEIVQPLAQPELTLTEIQALTSQQRMGLIARLQKKVVDGGKITEQEARLGNRLLRAERGARVEAGGKKRAAKKADAQPSLPAFDLGALVTGTPATGN